VQKIFFVTRLNEQTCLLNVTVETVQNVNIEDELFCRWTMAFFKLRSKWYITCLPSAWK